MKYNKGDLVQVVNQDSAYRIEKVFKRDYAPYKVRNMADGRWDIVEEDELKPWSERKVTTEERIAKLEAEVTELKSKREPVLEYDLKKISEVEPGDKVVTREGPVVEIVQTTKTVSVGEENKYSLVDANYIRRLAGTDKTTPEVKVVKEVKQYEIFRKPVRDLQVGDMVDLNGVGEFHELLKIETRDNMTKYFRYYLWAGFDVEMVMPFSNVRVRVDRDSR